MCQEIAAFKNTKKQTPTRDKDREHIMPALQDPLKNGKMRLFAHSDWLSSYGSSSLNWEREDQKDKGVRPPPRCPAHLYYCVQSSVQGIWLSIQPSSAKGKDPWECPSTHIDEVPRGGWGTWVGQDKHRARSAWLAQGCGEGTSSADKFTEAMSLAVQASEEAF